MLKGAFISVFRAPAEGLREEEDMGYVAKPSVIAFSEELPSGVGVARCMGAVPCPPEKSTLSKEAGVVEEWGVLCASLYVAVSCVSAFFSASNPAD